MHKIIGEYLTRLGFDEGASRLYEALVAKGPLTILEASRATGIERTALLPANREFDCARAHRRSPRAQIKADQGGQSRTDPTNARTRKETYWRVGDKLF